MGSRVGEVEAERTLRLAGQTVKPNQQALGSEKDEVKGKKKWWEAIEDLASMSPWSLQI